MATSDYDFNVTRNELIQRAFRMVGALSLGETLSSEMLDQGVTALNGIVKSWQGRNVFLWTRRLMTQTLTNGNASYSLSSSDPAVIGIEKAALLQSDNTEDPVDVVSFGQYFDIPDKASTGTPYITALDYQITPTLYVYPVPTQTWTLKYLAIVKLQDFDTAGGNPNFPSRYIEALTYTLAHKLAPEYGLPLSERKQLATEAANEFRLARGGEKDSNDMDFVQGAYKS